MSISNKRQIQKVRTLTGATPSIGPTSNHQDRDSNEALQWGVNDIYTGEFFINTADNKVWVGGSLSPIELMTVSGVTGNYLPTTGGTMGTDANIQATTSLRIGSSTFDSNQSFLLTRTDGIAQIRGNASAQIQSVSGTNNTISTDITLTPTTVTVNGNTTINGNLSLATGKVIKPAEVSNTNQLNFDAAENALQLGTSADGVWIQGNYVGLFANNWGHTLEVTSTGINLASTNVKINGVKRKEINIGVWNMDTTLQVSVAHGLSATEWKTVRKFFVTIINDLDTHRYDLKIANISVTGHVNLDSTNFNLTRTGTDFFDSTDFDDAVMNRGFITFEYTPD